MKKKCILVTVALLAAAELPALTKGEVTALWASAGVGAALGIGFDVLYVTQSFPMLQPVSEPWVVPSVKAATLAVQTVSATGLAVAFTGIYTALKPDIWWSIPAGALLAGIAQSLSCGLAVGTFQAIAAPSGALQVSDPSFRAGLPWWQYFGEGFVMGFLAFGIVGLLEGAIAGPVLTLSLGY